MTCPCEQHEAVWQGITIAITYEPNWLDYAPDEVGFDRAHLEIEAIAPACAMLPITETGYRSHFTSAETVESYGGPVAFVLAWLDEEAASPAWKRHAEAARQFALL